MLWFYLGAKVAENITNCTTTHPDNSPLSAAVA